MAEGQAEAIQQALAVAEVKPETIGYVEAHGTATNLGDPVEIMALTKAFQTNQRQFCAIGSVKSNIGHPDSASGVTGLIKAVLSLKHKTLYPSLHFSTPNPKIKFENTPFYVSQKVKEWEAQAFPRRAAVNSLGIGGTNAYVILEEAPSVSSVSSLSAPAPADAPVERPVHLLTLSAKTAKALQELAERYHEHLRQHPAQSFTDVCYTANTGRTHFEHRLALVAGTREEAIEQLESFHGLRPADEIASPVKKGYVKRNRAPRIAFLFTGQGSQYVNMGRDLYETQPIFRQTIDRCDEILRPLIQTPLLDILYPSQPEQAELINQTAITQPALFAIEYALAKLWQSWGVEPDVVMGHSVGEYVAACIAGVFSLEDGLRLVAERGRLMQALPQNGTMLAVLAGEPVVVAAIASYASSRSSVRPSQNPVRPSQSSVGGELSIAAINGPENVVISGDRQAIQTIAQTFEMQDIRTKELLVSHAFHSPLMEPMLDSFAQVVSEVRFAPPTLNFISNVTGKLVTNDVVTPAYWVRHVRQPVRFADGMQTLHENGYDVFVEIGPKPLLLGMGRRCLRATPAWRDGYGVWLPSLRPTLSQDNKRRGDWQQMLDTLAELYVRGAKVDWVDFERDHARRRVALPTYAWQRKRDWLETKTITEKKDILDDQNEVLQMDYRQNGHATTHLKTIVQQVQQEVANSLQINPLHLDIDTPMVELGSDSLLFMEVARAIKGTYGVKVGIRQFFEELDTVNALAAYVHQSLPPEWFSSQNGHQASSQPAISLPSTPAHPSLTISNGARGQRTTLATAPPVTAATASHPATLTWQGDSTLERMMSQQIQAMSELMSQNTLFNRTVVGRSSICKAASIK